MANVFKADGCAVAGIVEPGSIATLLACDSIGINGQQQPSLTFVAGGRRQEYASEFQRNAHPAGS